MPTARKIFCILSLQFLASILCLSSVQLQAQSAGVTSNTRVTNACGVTALISPGNDSVVTTNIGVFFNSASINATSFRFIIDNIVFPDNMPVNISIPVGLTEIKLVAINGSCTDTAVCYYFYRGTFPPDP